MAQTPSIALVPTFAVFQMALQHLTTYEPDHLNLEHVTKWEAVSALIGVLHKNDTSARVPQ